MTHIVQAGEGRNIPIMIEQEAFVCVLFDILNREIVLVNAKLQ